MSQTSHVKKVREIFESHNHNQLESLDIPQIRLRNSKDSPFHTFKRSQTLIDFRRHNSDDENGENLNGTLEREEKTAQDSFERKSDSPRRQFERQNSNNSDSSTYRSVRRSPAFRRAEDLKKPVTPPKVVKLTRQSPIAKPAVKKELLEELQYLATSETIKKALRSPLPAGPAPPKPPRTFGASPQSSPSREINIAAEFENSSREDLKEVVQSPQVATIQLELEKKLQIKPKILPKKRVEEKKTLGNIFQCIIPTCSIDPIYKEQIKREQAQKKDDEKIYMEPFAHLDKEFNSNDNSFSSNLSSTPASIASPAKTEELHYMCTNLNIFDQTNNINNNQQHNSDSRRSSLDEDNNYYYSTNSSEVDTHESYDKVVRKKIIQTVLFYFFGVFMCG
jgi:hypothetical protein